MAETALKIESLKVRYGFLTAVENMALELERGESLGLLGTNGAGKTSTIRAVLGMVPYQGKVEIFESRVYGWKIFKRLGFAPEEALPPDYLNGTEYLNFVGAFRIQSSKARRQEVTKWISLFDLSPEKKIRDYSKGMKRKIILAQAFLGSPDFLILDEPLNGLDPIMIMRLREVISEYRAQGGTVLCSSHILSEVEKSCTRVAILRKGRLVLDEKVPSVVKDYGGVENAFAKAASGEMSV